MNKQKPVLTRSYHIPLSMFDHAFRNFQKKFVYPRNLILTVLLAAVGGWYVYAQIKKPDGKLGYLMIMVCLAMILITWYNTFKIRRTLMDAIKEIEQDTYELTVYPDGLSILAKDAEGMPFAEAEEASAEETAPAQEGTEKAEENGFQDIFDEKPASAASSQKPTEIELDRYVKTYEYPDYFMVYLTAAKNFYLIPKKDFSDAELSQLRDILQQNQNR